MTLSPLQRLQVNDGMLITADHWQIAHSYHRRRQAIHYESLHQGGIVSGLGVSVGPIPEEASARYRQDRWLTIRPGLAIDSQGNPIVVSQTECCYLSAQPTEPTTIYVVLKHSERTVEAGVEVVQEAFQILEKDSPPQANEVELCRLQLLPECDVISHPQDVFSPGDNQLDLRFRLPLRSQPQLQVKVSGWSGPETVQACFRSLLSGTQSLYSSLCGEWVPNLLQSDLGHLPYSGFCQLDRSEQQRLGDFIKRGGVVLLEANNGTLAELLQVEAELSATVAGNHHRQKSDLQLSAEQELREIRLCISDAVEKLALPLQDFMHDQQLPMADKGVLATDHPLRSHPFLFSQLPAVNGHPIGLYAWGGLVLIIGPLSSAWRADLAKPISRETLRSAQELGINLLHFAARRRQMQITEMQTTGTLPHISSQEANR